LDPEEAGNSVELERCVHALVIMLQVSHKTIENFYLNCLGFCSRNG
jgi:hypothetical protein